MAIGKGKKRYYVTLTKTRVDRFQSLCKRLGMPPSTMSNALDDMVDNISDVFQTALDKGNIEISDLFRVMGQQMELLEEDKKTDARQKRNTPTG